MLEHKIILGPSLFPRKKVVCILLYMVFLGYSLKIEAQEKTTKPLALIIDADTANEIDDLYAIVRAIQEPSFNLLGISSAQFHTSPLATDSTVYESQRLNKALIELMGKKDIPLPLGSNLPLKDKSTPAISPAAAFIIKKAHELPIGTQLNIAILGSCTNVASAVLQDPSIVPKLKVHYIGFWHDVTSNSYDKKEFNSGNDPLAVDVLLNTEGLDFNVMTATTCQHLVFDKDDVDAHLKGKGGVGDYLVNRWETYERWWTTEDPEKKKWIMWDLAIIEALAHPELAEKELFLSPKENVQRTIGIYTSIAVEKMRYDFWKTLDATINK